MQQIKNDLKEGWEGNWGRKKSLQRKENKKVDKKD